MDSTVDDFLNEINEIAPPKHPTHDESVWKECQDELTGYSYYWNTKTDEVTWSSPSELKNESKKDMPIVNRPNTLPFPPKRIQEITREENTFCSPKEETGNVKTISENKPHKRPYNPESDSEDEKIVLISSYGGDSESEDEENENLEKKVYDAIPKKPKHEEPLKNNNYQSEEEDDLDILARIQKRAQELKELGGELPPDVAKITNIPEETPSKSKEKTVISGFSLVAGYSDSEEEENDELKTVFDVPNSEPIQVSHSTLFPITQPVDVNDFQPPPEQKQDEEEKSNDFISKAFQRKKRIGVALINTAKRKEIVETKDVHSSNLNNDLVTSEKVKLYPGFEKGGVMFVKSDVINPPLPNSESNESNNVTETKDKLVDKAKVEEMYSTLIEKLGFLNSAHVGIPPTQTMVIQAETLFVAMKDGGLKLTYLQKWLNETCTELVNLERDATPEGWLLLWDRSHKRYYYQNRATGTSQWEYPQPDIQSCDDAMDISTTPPPEQVITMSPPLPPAIRSPTPPPPPIISALEDEGEIIESSIQPLPVPLLDSISIEQPLPPGVEMTDMSFNKNEDQEVKQDLLHSALDSFYSDIAAIEHPVSGEVFQHPLPVEERKATENCPMETNQDNTKKKKKKVKLAPGLALKKKGVSQLVEKWKNVQQHYND